MHCFLHEKLVNLLIDFRLLLRFDPLPSEWVFEEISEDTADAADNSASLSLQIWSDQYFDMIVLFFTACHLVFDISKSTCARR